MDIHLLLKLVGLGLAAFDPVGVAATLLLLAQPKGIARAWVFILGSVTALMIFGVAVASGLGHPIVEFSRRYPWLDGAIELGAGVILVVVAGWLLWHSRRNEGSSLTPDAITRRLRLPLFMLFLFGFVLVTVQSIVDVVFLLAMVEMGTRLLGIVETVIAVGVYTLAALLIQLFVVIGYQALPEEKKAAALVRFNDLLEKRGEIVAGVLALLLGLVLIAMNLGPYMH